MLLGKMNCYLLVNSTTSLKYMQQHGETSMNDNRGKETVRIYFKDANSVLALRNQGKPRKSSYRIAGGDSKPSHLAKDAVVLSCFEGALLFLLLGRQRLWI